VVEHGDGYPGLAQEGVVALDVEPREVDERVEQREE
jgi:hypothetical protein